MLNSVIWPFSVFKDQSNPLPPWCPWRVYWLQWVLQTKWALGIQIFQLNSLKGLGVSKVLHPANCILSWIQYISTSNDNRLTYSSSVTEKFCSFTQYKQSQTFWKVFTPISHIQDKHTHTHLNQREWISTSTGTFKMSSTPLVLHMYSFKFLSTSSVALSEKKACFWSFHLSRLLLDNNCYVTTLQFLMWHVCTMGCTFEAIKQPWKVYCQ